MYVIIMSESKCTLCGSSDYKICRVQPICYKCYRIQKEKNLIDYYMTHMKQYPNIESVKVLQDMLDKAYEGSPISEYDDIMKIVHKFGIRYILIYFSYQLRKSSFQLYDCMIRSDSVPTYGVYEMYYFDEKNQQDLLLKMPDVNEHLTEDEIEKLTFLLDEYRYGHPLVFLRSICTNSTWEKIRNDPFPEYAYKKLGDLYYGNAIKWKLWEKVECSRCGTKVKEEYSQDEKNTLENFPYFLLPKNLRERVWIKIDGKRLCPKCFHKMSEKRHSVLYWNFIKKCWVTFDWGRYVDSMETVKSKLKKEKWYRRIRVKIVDVGDSEVDQFSFNLLHKLYVAMNK